MCDRWSTSGGVSYTWNTLSNMFFNEKSKARRFETYKWLLNTRMCSSNWDFRFNHQIFNSSDISWKTHRPCHITKQIFSFFLDILDRFKQKWSLFSSVWVWGNCRWLKDWCPRLRTDGVLKAIYPWTWSVRPSGTSGTPCTSAVAVMFLVTPHFSATTEVRLMMKNQIHPPDREPRAFCHARYDTYGRILRPDWEEGRVTSHPLRRPSLPSLKTPSHCLNSTWTLPTEAWRGRRCPPPPAHLQTHSSPTVRAWKHQNNLSYFIRS